MTELECKAREYSDDKADKGNYDYAVGDAVYFSRHSLEMAYIAGAEPREKRIEELKEENEYLQRKCDKLEKTLKKVRVALIQERTANIMNYGKGGVEMFNDCFEILKGVSND